MCLLTGQALNTFVQSICQSVLWSNITQCSDRIRHCVVWPHTWPWPPATWPYQHRAVADLAPDSAREINIYSLAAASKRACYTCNIHARCVRTTTVQSEVLWNSIFQRCDIRNRHHCHSRVSSSDILGEGMRQGLTERSSLTSWSPDNSTAWGRFGDTRLCVTSCVTGGQLLMQDTLYLYVECC